MHSNSTFPDQRSGNRSLDRYNFESRHISDKLYPQSGYSTGFDDLHLNRGNLHSRNKAQYDSPRSDVSGKRTKDPKSVSDIFARFSDTTSLQGIPFIRAASRWYAKLFWVLIFLAAMGVWILHSVTLIQSYITFDTNSQVKITHEPLDFPTVTFCNINPIRENTIATFGGDELQDYLELLKPREAYDRKRRKKRQSVDSAEDVDRDHDFSFFNTIDWTQYGDVGIFEDYLDAGYSSSYLAKLLLREMLTELPPNNRTQMGHRLGDMMLGCSYDGITCNAKNFTRFLDISYGNCFSFNSAVLYENAITSTASGSSFGLDIILYIQNREYIKGIQQGRGIRLEIHPFGTQPFVEESGISVPTGFQTYLGLRQVRQTRKGGRYGDCGDDGAYRKYYGNYRYTLEGCSQTCIDRIVRQDCGCFRGSRRQFYNDDDLNNLRPCRSNSEIQCVERVEADYASDKVTCNCRQACNTTDFDYLLSYDQWPDESLWHSLADAVCDSVSQAECDYIQMQVEEDDRDEFLYKNFIHLKIYYRDLNLETIKEVEAYEDIQFYSDLGGAVGLWLGASVITLVELMDLLCRCIQFCAKRKTYQKRKEIKERYGEDRSGVSAPPARGSPAQNKRSMDDFRSNYSDNRAFSSRHRGNYY